MPTWLTALLAVAVGMASGVLSAVAGVGGAILTTPGIRALGATPIMAVGSTVPAIIPSALTGAYHYSRAGLVDWRVAVGVGVPGTFSALFGAWTAGQVNAGWLMVTTALLVLWSSTSLFRADRRARRLAAVAPEGAPDPPGAPAAGTPAAATPAAGDAAAALAPRSVPTPVLAALGLLAGYAAGLLGIGGGLVLVPAFTVLLRMGVKHTVATSLVAVALMSVSSLVGHAMAGHIDWAFAIPLAIGVVPGARIGARFTVGADEHVVRMVCGTVLAVIGFVYLASELVALA